MQIQTGGAQKVYRCYGCSTCSSGSVQFSSFSCCFRQNLCQTIGLAPSPPESATDIYFRFLDLFRFNGNCDILELHERWYHSYFPISLHGKSLITSLNGGRCACNDLTALDSAINWTWRLIIVFISLWGMLKFIAENITIKFWSLIGPNIFLVLNR